MAVTINGNNTPTAGGVVYGDGSTYASTTAGSAGSVLYSAGASAPAFTAVGTAGQVLQSNGAAAPSWTAGASAATPTALGTVYGAGDTGAYGNSFYGYQSGNGNTASAANNTALGHASLYTNASGTWCTAAGFKALYFNNGVGTDFNTAFGGTAMYYNSTGANCTAVGYRALFSNDTASNNTAVGYQAAYSVTTTSGVTAIGYQALYSVQTDGSGGGGKNTAVGYKALYANVGTNGYFNTALGYNALTNTTGGNNIGVGLNAGAANTTANSGIYIGSGADASGSGTSSEVVIGTNIVGKGNGTFFVQGAASGGSYNAANTTTWSTTSDQRLKKNIVDNNVGLTAINSIRVRNFEYRVAEEITELPTHAAIKKDGVQLGVIAQELQAVLPECVKTESTGVLSVDSDNLTWYMINAIKELKAELDAYKASHP